MDEMENGSIVEAAKIEWENRDQIGFFKALLATIKQVLFRPTSFFDALASKAPVKGALLFYICVGVLVGVVASIIGSVTNAVLFGQNTQNAFLAAPSLAVTVVVMPIMLIIGLYLGAAVLNFVAKIFGGKADFEKTLNVLAFSSSAQVWSLVPLLGGIVSFFWMFYLQIKGLSRIHELSVPKVVLVLVTPFFFITLLVGVIALILFSLAG